LFEIFGEDSKIHELSKNIIFISIGALEEKIWYKKPIFKFGRLKRPSKKLK